MKSELLLSTMLLTSGICSRRRERKFSLAMMNPPRIETELKGQRKRAPTFRIGAHQACEEKVCDEVTFVLSAIDEREFILLGLLGTFYLQFIGVDKVLRGEGVGAPY